MLAFIEKQQVGRRLPTYRDNTHSLPAVVERPSSVAAQRWIARRERHPDRTEAAVAKVPRDPFLERDRRIKQSERRAFRHLSRIASAPAVSLVIVAVVLAAVASAASVGGKPGRSSLPRGGLALPADNQIAAALTVYSRSLEGPKPDLAVRIPNPTILHALKTTTYTMKPGDTLSGIAQKTHISLETLISFNGITDARRISAGTELRIPSMNGILYRVEKGDTLEGIAKQEGVKLADILDVNGIKSSVIVPGQELFVPGGHMSTFAFRKALGTLFEWPTTGVITSPFGMRHDPFTGTMEFHNGIDIANAIGTSVDAAMDGQVALVGRNRGYGIFIIIDHGDGYQTLYGHLSKTLVKTGEQVRAGQQIALMGDTGYATGPHLHFTIYKNSVPVNPLQYLPKR